MKVVEKRKNMGLGKKQAFKPVLKERCFRNMHPNSASFLLTLRFYFLYIRPQNFIYYLPKE